MKDNQNFSRSLYNLFFDICIIGGGASGMAAAISAVETNPSLSVCIIEKKNELGKKLLATGNGRCNITNRNCEEFQEVETFLKHTGIMLKEDEEGRFYPYSEQSSAVVELLKRRIKTLNIATFTNCEVVSVAQNENEQFAINIDCEDEIVSIPCNKVILASGGKAGPQYGTTGDGYAIAKTIGHSIKKLYPILMPVECESINKELKGIRAKGKVALLKNDKPIAEEFGEIQFTEYGLSGICVFNLTRYINLEEYKDIPLQEAFNNYSIEVDFLPFMEECEIVEYLKERRFYLASLTTNLYLASIVNLKLGEAIVNSVMEENIVNIGNIDNKRIEEIAMLLKSSRYVISGARGWKEAQCTGGGVPFEEIELLTMESKLKKGVYFSGEILDFDGPCGGFNLNHSWVTGIRAGKSAAEDLTNKMLMGE